MIKFRFQATSSLRGTQEKHRHQLKYVSFDLQILTTQQLLPSLRRRQHEVLPCSLQFLLPNHQLLTSPNTIKADDFNVRVFAGGVYSYAFNNKVSASQAIQEGFKKFDKSNIGVTGGVGLDYKNFTVDLRYETGLTSISKEFKSKPHSFSLGIGYFLF